MSKKELDAGWTFEPSGSAVYHFRHIPIAEARTMAGQRESVYVIETINWTYGKNQKEVHHNEYFALNLSSAIAMAARIEIEAQNVAEEVVLIRMATPKEAQEFLKVADHFKNVAPPVLSERKARTLP